VILSRTTWRLLSAVVLTGAFLWVFDSGREEAGRRLRQRRVVPLDGQAVERLAVRSAALTVAVEKRDADWWLVGPVTARADSVAVGRVLDVLGQLRTEEVIRPAQWRERGLSPASYGLAPPQATLEIGRGAVRHVLGLGIRAPLGPLMYANLDGSDTVLAVSDSLAAALPTALDEWRERALWRGDVRRSAKLEIERPGGGFVQLVRRGAEWQLHQPMEARADGSRVRLILDALSAMRVERFVAEGRVDPIPYGLTAGEAALQVTVWPTEDSSGQRVLLGKALPEESDLVYAHTEGVDNVVAVRKWIVDRLNVKGLDLRDRRLLALPADEIRQLSLQEGESRVILELKAGGWTIVEPVQARADDESVGLFLRRLTALRAVEYGSGLGTNGAAAAVTNGVRLTVSDTLPGPAASNTPPVSPRTATVWLPAAGSTQDVVVVAAGTGELLCRVAAADLAALMPREEARGAGGPLFANPLRFRDRGVLGLKAETIKRVVVTREGVEEAVLREAPDRPWSVEAPEGAAVAEEAVADLVAWAGTLRAVAILPAAPARLAAYGLAEPAARITFGLTGDGGIQKTLLLGGRAGAEGRYALVQGQDVVYVLDRSAALLPGRSIVK
jgi:hypothetical protein